MSNMEKLLKKRIALVKRIDSLKAVVDKHGTTPFTSEIAVKEHLKRLENLVETHEDLHNQIVSQCKTTAEVEASNGPFEIEDSRLTAISIELQTILKSLSISPGNPGPSGAPRMSAGNADIKLPKLELPSFSGEIHQWISFQDLFTASVHNNKNLSAAQKLQYLKAVLKGESALLIQSLPVTDANYAEAWSMLQNRYQNKREIIKANLDRLFAQQSIMQENPAALRKLVDTTNECVRAFSVMAIPPEAIADVILVHVISKKLDPESRLQWERSLKNDELPTIKNFCAFLDQHSRVTAAAKVGTTKPKPNFQPTSKTNVTTTVHHGAVDSVSTIKCVLCNEEHLIYKCQKFLDMSVSDRIKFAKQKKLCYNCLKTSHSSNSCKSGDCRKCAKKHHTLLHFEESQPKPKTSEEVKEVQPAVTTTLVNDIPVTTQVLLQTAKVIIVDSRGNDHVCRALLDPASQASIIKEYCVQRLGLQRNRVQVPVTGLGGVSVGSCRTTTRLQLRSSADTDFCLDMNALVFAKVTQALPHTKFNPKQWPHLSNLPLADPTFNVPGEIDILLGADVYGELFLGGIVKGPSGTPYAINTVFGWVLGGKASSSPSLPSVSIHHIDCNLDETLQKFWEIEEIPKKTILTNEEAVCEKHFDDTHTRDSNGAYIVRLPFRSSRKPIGESRNAAIQRLKQMERRFSSQPKFKELYNQVLQEYIDLGHMEEVPNTSDICAKEHFYMPHHGVINEASSTTKLRVVFDASAKSSTGISLNETLMVGPKLQQDLTSILIRFRKHKIALTADIAKMYRQVRVHSDDTDYQRIVWRQSPNETIKDYRLLTATFGTSAAPYLAIKCLQQLAKDETEFSEASEVLLQDMYVDDLLSVAENEKKAFQLQKQLIQITRRGNFELRKWSSNSAVCLESLPQEARETKIPLRIDTDEKIKTLGIAWNPASDAFSFSVVPPPYREIVTKRTLLSDLAKVFDPLGWLSPTTIKAKILFQSLWTLNLTWDESLNKDLSMEWKKYTEELSDIGKIKLERFILQDGTSENRLMGFCDASEKAYSAAVYLRSSNATGEVKVKLVAAKTKVAPLKQISLPRLELCGAVLLIRLTEIVKESLMLDMQAPIFYTDSTIVLAWLRSPPQRWKTFIANRVSEIQDSSTCQQWNHVSSEDNPADCASRGISPSALASHPLWWNGPVWLMEKEIPITKVPENAHGENIEERKPPSIVVSHLAVDNTLLSKYSSLPTLLKVTAYCQRFLKNFFSKDPEQRQKGPLLTHEYNSALMFWIRRAQDMEFRAEILCLKKMQPLPSKSKLVCLNPFLDDNGTLRVGGRLNLAAITSDRKHPVLLPRKSVLTTLIINYEHLRNFHAGPQLLLATLQRKYWIISGRDTVRHLIRKCVDCHRLSAKTLQPLMGNLPKSRVTPSRPFLICGVDYAGPLSLKVSSLRGKGPQKTTKAYICLFVCFSTKAVHLELVSDLTTECFLAALKRFVSRRGKPSDIYSDCGTTFVGANRQLKELLQLVNSKQHAEKVVSTLVSEGINWHYSVPAFPTFGGLWEAGVKSVKFHLRRVIGNVTLNFEEMTTTLTQIEACLNSRPLTATSSDPNDLAALTPGHFLIGGPLNAIPEPELTFLPVNRLSRWQLTQQLVQHFWNRWNSEYLSRLQQRPKWCKPERELQIGELILLKNEKLLPTKWKLGRILELHPGKDGIVRVITLKTADGIFQRPVVKVSPLPLPQEDSET